MNLSSGNVLTKNAAAAADTVLPPVQDKIQMDRGKATTNAAETNSPLKIVDGGVRLPDNLVNLSE